MAIPPISNSWLCHCKFWFSMYSMFSPNRKYNSKCSIYCGDCFFGAGPNWKVLLINCSSMYVFIMLRVNYCFLKILGLLNSMLIFKNNFWLVEGKLNSCYFYSDCLRLLIDCWYLCHFYYGFPWLLHIAYCKLFMMRNLQFVIYCSEVCILLNFWMCHLWILALRKL